nr:unnamed protein product [Callosobruchus chinensis]
MYPKSMAFDGTPDCDDRSDEPESCGTLTVQITSTSAYICDGKKDCEDGSDESYIHACGKPPFRCPHTQWQCPGVSERCVNITSVCDGKPDCPNGADEGPGCDLADANTRMGPLCLCPEGEKVSNDQYKL